MCLGIPMQIISMTAYSALCTAKNTEREVNLIMMLEENLSVDDFIVVHAGYDIQKISEEEAKVAWDLYDQMLEL
jgi:hydrogenase expression/formation protein HypC